MFISFSPDNESTIAERKNTPLVVIIFYFISCQLKQNQEAHALFSGLFYLAVELEEGGREVVVGRRAAAAA